MNNSGFKVIIIGGGIAGPALALFLKKAGITAEVYEARSPGDVTGGGINLAPNGLRVLASLNLDKKVVDAGTVVNHAWFRNAAGQTLAKIKYSDPEKYDQPGISISRGSLNTIISDEMKRQNIPVHFGKKLISIEQTPENVTAFFDDGSRIFGDILVGADGVNSRTREYLFPQGPFPEFTGIIGSGGFVNCRKLENIKADEISALNFVYGKKGFFGFGGSDKNEIMWWTNTHALKPYSKNELLNFDIALEKKELLSNFKNYPPIISEIITHSETLMKINVFDIQSLPVWSGKNIILIGDAAHAVSPNSGQGAALALEDAMMLAKMLRQEKCIEDAFSGFEKIRKHRVEKIVSEGRRRGEDKEITGPVNSFIREILIRIFVNLFGVKGNHWLFNYKIDWDD